MKTDESKVTRNTDSRVGEPGVREKLVPITVKWYPSELRSIEEAAKRETNGDRSAYIRSKVLGSEMRDHVKVRRRRARKRSVEQRQLKQETVMRAYIFRSLELLRQEVRNETKIEKRLATSLVLERLESLVATLGVEPNPSDEAPKENLIKNVPQTISTHAAR